jgi:outer membrane biosynthesis protein TonB
MVVTATAEQRAKIETLSLFVAEPGSTAELEVRVGPPEAMPKNAYIRIRGLPATASLSDGFVVTAGVWSVPLAALGTLRVTLPKGVSGRSELTISLLDVDGKVLAETRSALVVAQVNLRAAIAPEAKPVPKPEPKADLKPDPTPDPKPQSKAEPQQVPPKPELPKVELPKPAPKPAPIVETPPPPPQEPRVERAVKAEPPPAASAPPAPPSAVSAEARQRNARMLEQGDKALSLGNIASARQYYLRAAEAGDAAAALKLAETYDPAELVRLKAQGITGDLAEAKRWYERARDLGAVGATEKLSKLAGR